MRGISHSKNLVHFAKKSGNDLAIDLYKKVDVSRIVT
jgi:hypothetical protein